MWLMLAAARLKLLVGGLSSFTDQLTCHRSLPDAGGISAMQRAEARELGSLVAIAARYSPWRGRCLIQVLVLQQLLAQRQIPGFFCLGVRKADDTAKALDAHAWLQCGDVFVNGATPERHYTALSSFSWGL